MTDFLKKSLNFQMNGDNRICVAVLSTERERFAIKDPDPIEIPIPFYLMKEAVAQILEFEAMQAIEKLPKHSRMDPGNWPNGIRGVKKVAQLLMDAAQAEKAGDAMTDDKNLPLFQANLKAIV